MNGVKTKNITHWCIAIPRVLDDTVEKAVCLDSHITKSDLIREAVREKLEKMGYRSEPFKEVVAAP